MRCLAAAPSALLALQKTCLYSIFLCCGKYLSARANSFRRAQVHIYGYAFFGDARRFTRKGFRDPSYHRTVAMCVCLLPAISSTGPRLSLQARARAAEHQPFSLVRGVAQYAYICQSERIKLSVKRARWAATLRCVRARAEVPRGRPRREN